jgi:hypothetical protein
MGLFATLSIISLYKECCYAECRYSECHGAQILDKAKKLAPTNTLAYCGSVIDG